MTQREFEEQQRGVSLAMAGALVMTILILGIAAASASRAEPMPFVERLQGALRVDLLVVVWLGAAIANVARLRFFSAHDIAGSSAGEASEKVRSAGAILQNTLEQVVLAVVTHLIVAASFDRSSRVIVALAGLFAAGRLLFWAGYKHGARGRAFGFALTFYPTLLALLASAATALFDAAVLAC